jgi:tetratricopeptide (TPR) repeat protein
MGQPRVRLHSSAKPARITGVSQITHPNHGCFATAVGIVVSLVFLGGPSRASDPEATRAGRERSQPARDASLGHIRSLFEQLYFSEAEQACERALARGHHTRRELLELYRLRGLIASAAGERDQAFDAFRQLLVLGGKAELDSRMPPRTRKVLEEASRWASHHGRLEVLAHPPQLIEHRPAAAALRFELEVRADPLDMVSDALLVLEVEGKTRRFLAQQRDNLRWSLPLATLGLLPGKLLNYRILVRDAQANQIVQLQRRYVVPPAPAGALREGAPGAPATRRLWTWIAASGAAAALGLGIGLRVWAGSLNEEWQRDPSAIGRSQEDWNRLRDTGRGAETAAYVSLGIGALLAAGSAVLFWLEGRPSPREGAEPLRAASGIPLVLSDRGVGWVERF